jgi:hypothetical protein
VSRSFIEADGGPSCIDAWSDIHVCNRICTLLRLLPVDKLRAHLDRQRAEQSAALHARLRAEQAGDDIGDGDGGALFREPSVASEEPISVGEEDANMTFVDGVAAALRKHARADSSDSAAEPQEPPASDDDAKAAKGVAPKTTTSNSTKASTPKTTLPTAPATDRIGTRSVVASRAAAGAGTGAAADGRQDDESLAASTSTAAPPPKKAKKKAVA